MPKKQVFLSYRRESQEHARAVRRLGELLRQVKVPLVLDQFYLDEHPGGPDEGWPKWLADCAQQSECVLIIGSEGWFGAYTSTVPASVGLGAAFEAGLFRAMLRDEKGGHARFGLALLEEMPGEWVPEGLRAVPQFRPFESGPHLDQLVRWLAQCLGLGEIEPPAIPWPAPLEYTPDFADRAEEWQAIVDLLSGRSKERILLISGAAGLGKSTLVRAAADYSQRLGLPVVRIDFKGGIRDVPEILEQLELEIGRLQTGFSGGTAQNPGALRKNLRALRRPLLAIFDTYESASGNSAVADWLSQHFLAEVETALGLAVIVAGRMVPDRMAAGWRAQARRLDLKSIGRLEDWEPWLSRKYPGLQGKGVDLRPIISIAQGNPALVASCSEAIAAFEAAMHFADQLVQRLKESEGDGQAQAAIAAEFVLLARPEQEREPLREALDAAVVLRWFDADFLAQVLEIPVPAARERFDALCRLSFVEGGSSTDPAVRNVAESARLGWRRRLAKEIPERFLTLSTRAANCFRARPEPFARIEWIYQLLCANPDEGATELERLDRRWTDWARTKDREVLTSVLKELVESRLVKGRADLWVRLVIAWSGTERGELEQMIPVAEALVLRAKEVADPRAEADAQCLMGDALLARGHLEEARRAYARQLEISRSLVEQHPGDADGKRELAVAHSRLGDVFEALGRLEDAERAFAEALDISRQLAELDFAELGRQRRLSVAYNRLGDVYLARGNLGAALGAFEKDREISRKLVAAEPGVTGWQHDLAIAHSRVGEVLQAEGRLEEAQACYAKVLEISRQSAAAEPTRASVQRSVAMAFRRLGDLRMAQGRPEEAKVQLENALEIWRRLVNLDPGTKEWQRELEAVNGRYAELLKILGRPEEVRAAFEEEPVMPDRPPRGDPGGEAKTNPDGEREVPPARLFICYCSEDQEWRRRLKSTLAILRRGGVIEVWFDHMVGAGDDWDHEIQERLESSEIVLCLVSRHFLASDYIQDHELPKALQMRANGRTYLVPLVLTACSWERTPLYKLQTATGDKRPVSKWPDEADAYLRIQWELEIIWRKLRGLPWKPFQME